GSADDLGGGRQLRRADRHAVADAAAGNPRFHLDRPAGQHVRFQLSRPLPGERNLHSGHGRYRGPAERGAEAGRQAAHPETHPDPPRRDPARQPLLRERARRADEVGRQLSRLPPRPELPDPLRRSAATCWNRLATHGVSCNVTLLHRIAIRIPGKRSNAMSYLNRSQDPRRRTTALATVVIVHAALGYALVTG